MTEIVLKRKKEQFITIDFDGTKFNLPLGGSVPFVTLQKMKSEDGIMEFLGKYIPAEVLETLTSDDVTQIFTAWSKATEEAQGVNVGE